MNDPRALRRPLLYTLVGSVVLGAALGIVIVLRNSWGWFEVRVILTTVTVAVASLCGLACDLSRTPRGANLLPSGGLVLTLLAAAMILVGMWADIDGDGYWKATIIVAIFAVATVHVCLLSIAKLARRFRWITFITYQVVYGLAALLAGCILWELEDDRTMRFVATVAIIDAALTLIVPLLHRISRAELQPGQLLSTLEERSVEAIDGEITALKKRLRELEKLRSEIAGD